jgi:hypothetical protein
MAVTATIAVSNTSIVFRNIANTELSEDCGRYDVKINA